MRRRSLTDKLFWLACIIAFFLIAAPTVSVVISVIQQSAPALGWHLLTQDDTGPTAGLKNAIQGTLVLMVGVLIIGGIVGVSAGIWLAEYSSGRPGRVLRFMSEVLAGIPSIVIGYIGYIALVNGLHWHYSLLAALLALSTLVLPYIVKTTEVALRQVPTTLREASAGLGLTRTRTVMRILLPTAAPGIISGLIIALAISTGETAPLLFTANWSPSAPYLHLNLGMLTGHPLGYLTYVTFNDISQPGSEYHAQAAAAALVTLVILAILILGGRIIAGNFRKKTARMSL